MKKVKIKVTQDHIDKGKESSCLKCPITLALNIQLPKKRKWFVTSDAAHSTKGSEYKLPRSAQRFIEKFDAYGRVVVKPFNFYLHV